MTLIDEAAVPWYTAPVASQPVKGRIEPAVRVAGSKVVTVEPLMAGDRSGGELEQVERLSGRSLIGGLRVFSETEIKALDKQTGTEGDWLVWQGKTYEIISVGSWPGSSLSHWEALAAYMDKQPTLPS